MSRRVTIWNSLPRDSILKFDISEALEEMVEHSIVTQKLFDLARDVNFDKEEAQSLINQGADYDAKFHRGFSWPIIFEAIYHNNIKFVEFLLSNGADVNIIGCNKLTPLNYAVDRESIEIIDCLLNNPRVNVNLFCDEGYTPLNSACLKPRPKIVKSLLYNHTLNINIANKEGETPLDSVNYSLNDWGTSEWEKTACLEIIEMLKVNGAVSGSRVEIELAGEVEESIVG